jgi:hypothetical protein
MSDDTCLADMYPQWSMCGSNIESACLYGIGKTNIIKTPHS